MLSTLYVIFKLFDDKSQRKIIFFGFIKVILGVFDIIGIVLVGSLLGKLSDNGFTGSLRFLDLGNFSLIETGILAALAFLIKAFGSALFSKALINTLAIAHAKLASDIFAYSLKDISVVTKKYSKSELNFMLTVAPGAAIEILLGTITIISESFLLISVLLTFFTVNISMTIYVVIYFFIIIYGLNYFMSKKLKQFSSKEAENGIALTSIMYDTIDAFREIKSLQREEFFLKRFKRAKFEVANSSGKISFINSLPKNIVESALMLGSLGLLLVATSGSNPAESAQSIGIFLAGGLKIMSSILPLQATFASYNQQFVKLQMLLDFLRVHALDSKAINFQDRLSFSKYQNSPVGIKVSNLSFRYDDENTYALEHINLEITPGQIVAFIGASGAGKSTLADLIIGINEPTSGLIKFNDSSGSEVTRNDFRIGYVAQSPGIISGSIKDNVALGLNNDEIDQDALDVALNGAHLSQIIENLSGGVDSDLGKQSDSLSGGQLQRIGLARALYVKPNLLVLDEATSALDAESEGIVTEFISSLRGTCTVIVIAHRLTTVQNADNVFVFNAGKLEAQGKFAKLAKSNLTVAKFIELSEINTK